MSCYPKQVTFFQSTLPHGERWANSVKFAQDWWLSIHAPARGAIVGEAINPTAETFQSTLPHGERFGVWGMWEGFRDLSIHAPARGAMYRMDHPGMRMQLSIHAPARGAIDRFYISVFKGFFQSTLPHGERCGFTTFSHSANQSFNPRSRTGSDDIT